MLAKPTLKEGVNPGMSEKTIRLITITGFQKELRTIDEEYILDYVNGFKQGRKIVQFLNQATATEAFDRGRKIATQGEAYNLGYEDGLIEANQQGSLEVV